MVIDKGEGEGEGEKWREREREREFGGQREGVPLTPPLPIPSYPHTLIPHTCMSLCGFQSES